MSTIAIPNNNEKTKMSFDSKNFNQNKEKTSLFKVFDVSLSEATLEFSKEMRAYTIQCFNTYS
ncbi:hypothetical protein J8281_00325 [Aquimarina sp. U1-2]|uniref:hypothetical protein n=1 Tax=Aquimarina sp. U1-2 TaxID=2823141 RepID=UPI001AED08DE|nr:hypothetical protein [Aquimarina sp. U1-2]MBP2830614.1 hypothetical protein [Aquimarina sp. U1-2]